MNTARPWTWRPSCAPWRRVPGYSGAEIMFPYEAQEAEELWCAS